MARKAKSTRWCATLNNPTPVEIEHIAQQAPTFGYIIHQLEKGENGTVHIQAYLETKKDNVKGYQQLTMSQMKQRLGDRWHFEICRGDQESNIAYCSKQDTRADPGQEPTEYGQKRTGQGTRTDLEAAARRCMEPGVRYIDMCREHPGVCLKYSGNVKQMIQGKNEDIQRLLPGENPKIFLLIGPPGSGKSFWAQHHYPEAFVWSLDNCGGNSWMDGYNGQEACVLDDYVGGLKYNFFLTLLDRYTCHAQVKGGQVKVMVKTWIITSNKSPEEWYPYEDGLALKRRLNQWGEEPNYKQFLLTQGIVPYAPLEAPAGPPQRGNVWN